MTLEAPALHTHDLNNFGFSNYRTSSPKIPMSDASLNTLEATIDRVLGIEGKQRGITAPFIENKVHFPVSGGIHVVIGFLTLYQ